MRGLHASHNADNDAFATAGAGVHWKLDFFGWPVLGRGCFRLRLFGLGDVVSLGLGRDERGEGGTRF